MPLQNRVTPFGELIAVDARGTLTGNRGIIHNAERQIVRRWTTRRWIACALEFHGRRRAVMSPNTWTELFFLDEATAFAAGHRPCFFCRRADSIRFRDAWILGNPGAGVSTGDSIDRIDDVLHRDRTVALVDRPRCLVADVVPGAMFTVAGGRDAYLMRNGAMWHWSPAGYASAQVSPDAPAILLTPQSTVRAFAAGYVSKTHASAAVLETLQ